MSSDDKENDQQQNEIELQLGDVIQIFINDSDSEKNQIEYEKLNNQVFFIDYIDSKKLHIINDETLDTVILPINNGIIADGIIQNITIKYRNKNPGYAKQNDLLTGKWINIYFGGDVPAIITGEITNLEEDMIEVKTYPENSIIYINFDYKGIPDYLPIETIEIREKPKSISEIPESVVSLQSQSNEEETMQIVENEQNEQNEQLESSFNPPQSPENYDLEEGEIYEDTIINIPSSEIKQQLREFILKADEIVFGNEELGNVVQYININESRQRYSIETQTAELLDEMISSVPNKDRTSRVLNNIHIMIERFKQLRNTFSTFDENNNVNGMKFKEASWKPLVENLFQLKKSLYWILPVVKNTKKLYNIDENNNNINDYPDIVSLSLSENMSDFQKIFNNYKSNDTPIEMNKYITMIKDANPYMTPFENDRNNRLNQEININQFLNDDFIYNTNVNDNFEAIIDTLGDFYSSVFNTNLIKSKRFVIGKYNLGVNKLETFTYVGNKSKTQLVTLTKPDSMNIKSIVMLPKDAVLFSRVQLPGTNIMEKANLNNTFLNYWMLLNKNTYIENHFIDNEKLKINRKSREMNELSNQPQPQPAQIESRDFLKKPINYILDIDIEGFINENRENPENPENNQNDNSNLMNMQNKINNITVEYEKLYYDFLRAIIPKTRTLFYMMQKDIHNKYTFKDVVEFFEPFLIYQDDITYLQYNAIVKFINYKVTEFNKSYAEKYRYFQNIKNINFNKKTTVKINNMYNLINSITYSIQNGEENKQNEQQMEQQMEIENPEMERNISIKEIVIEKYHINGKNQEENTTTRMDSVEILNKINTMDNGRLFNSSISLNNLPLMFSDNLNSFFENETDEVKNNRKFMESRLENKCKNYIIAKQYQNINELEDDNQNQNQPPKTIYFDKKFDTTNYSLLNQYEKEMNKMDSDEFINFLVEKLQKSEKVSKEDAIDLVETLITGMKPVKNGYYAILYDSSKDVMHYYVRTNGMWILDENIDKDNFSPLNNQNILCNLQNDCISITNNKSASGMDCKTEEDTKSMLAENAIKTILSEFDKQYYQSKEELENKIKSVFEYYMTIFEKNEKIQNQRIVKYNNQQYLLGLEELKQNEFLLESESDAILNSNPYASPYAKLRDIILGQSDFVKKQNDIIRFTQMFTRENMKDTTVGPLGEIESIHWRYCTKTNVKLLPAFLYTLACIFINDYNNYNEKVEYIINDIGALSDDGDSWVDKNSGYIIKHINFDTEEGYEGGSKIKSREIMETETVSGIASVVSSEKGRTKQLEEEVKIKTTKNLSVENKIVMNIVNTLSESCMIDISKQHEFIMKTVSEALLKSLPNETDYNKQVKEMANKGKTIPPYKTIYNSTILYVTMGMFLIAVQTHIPSIKTKKTYPGCVRSFQGFPVDGETSNDYSSVEYIACIGYNIRTSIDPWSALQKQKRENITNRLRDTIQKILLLLPDVDQMIKDKVQYNITREMRNEKDRDEELENEHDIKTWTSFLPPLVNFKISRLSNITTEFKKTLLASLKNGGSQQREKMLVVESKIIEFSLAIQEKIQQIINKKKLLLTNKVNEPFVENACCNDTNIFKTIQYFEKESNGEITNYNKIVEELSNVLADINAITKSAYIVSNENTKNQYPTISNDFDEETIYRAFIVYCKFNSLIPISEELITLCNEKPKNVSGRESYNEMISKLKKEGRNYTNESLLRLLQLVNRKNIVDIEMNHRTIDSVEMIKNIIDNFNYEKEELIYPSLQQLLLESLDAITINKNSDEMEDAKEVRSLKNHLSRTNDTMKKDIIDFIKKNYKLTGVKPMNIEEILNDLFEWNYDDNEIRKNNCLNKMIQFIKSYIHNFASVFPNIILNTVDYEKIIIPSYLGLSVTHSNDIKNIIKKYYENLRPFYKNSHVSSVLNNIQNNTKNLLVLLNELPFLSANENNNSIFDLRLSKLLIEQFFFILFTEYINLANNESMLFGVDVNRRTTTTTTSKSQKSKLSKKTGKRGRGSELTIENPDRDFLIEDVFTVESLEEKEQFLGLENEVFENEYIRAPGEFKKLQTNIANLLLQYMIIMRDHKDIVDISYDKIMDKVFKIKEREKDTFTDRLKGKSDEARNVDTIMKINKLGEWGKGLQKGLTSYVKENYDEERDMMMNIASIERIVRRNPDVTDENVDQYMDDYVYNQNLDLEAEREAYDMTNQIDDYNDGNFEGEEVENWDEFDS